MSVKKELKVSNKTKNFKFNIEPSKILHKQLHGEDATLETKSAPIMGGSFHGVVGSQNSIFSDLQRVSAISTNIKKNTPQQSITETENLPLKTIGRPLKAKDKKLTVTVSLTFTKNDYEQLKNQYLNYCKQVKYDLSFTSYLRIRTLSGQD